MQGTDLDLLVDAARSAGDIAMRHFRSNPEIWEKDDNAGPVTEADLAVDRMLRDSLRAARPDYGWLSEETEDDGTRLYSDTLFIVDPIDGTRAFIEGSKDWGHSLAVVRNGQVTAAAVYMPVRDEMFAASRGGGATRNGLAIKVSTQLSIESADVLATRPNLAPEHWKDSTPPDFKRSFRSSLAYRLCLVANGRFDAMLTLRPSWEWDIAAGSLIIEEAGGWATDRSGNALRFNNPVPKVDGVVAGGALHPRLMDRLALRLPGADYPR